MHSSQWWSIRSNIITSKVSNQQICVVSPEKVQELLVLWSWNGLLFTVIAWLNISYLVSCTDFDARLTTFIYYLLSGASYFNALDNLSKREILFHSYFVSCVLASCGLIVTLQFFSIAWLNSRMIFLERISSDLWTISFLFTSDWNILLIWANSKCFGTCVQTVSKIVCSLHNS